MNLDLVTLVLALVCVGTVFTGAFGMLAHRHPDIGGPGWWSVAGLFGTVGYIGLTYRGQAPDFLTIVVANTLITTAMATSWLGVRAYMGMALPRQSVALGIAVTALLHWGMSAAWPSVYGRYVVFFLSGVLLSVLTLRDWNVYRQAHPIHPGLHALRLQTWLELLGFAAMGVVVTTRFASGEIREVSQQAHALILVFLASVAVRLAVYQVLVTARLQLQSDKASQSLAEREADLRGLIDNISAGVLVFLPDQTLSSANRAARSFFGWHLTEPIDQDLSDRTLWHLLAEDGQTLVKHAMPFYRVLATGQPVRDVILGFAPEGAAADSSKVRWALTSTFPENDAQGRLRHVVQTFVDVTSVREAQQKQEQLQHQLAQSQKMEALGTLAGGVAHDFNNILAAILGNSELARQDLMATHPSRESLHEISSAARRGRELVRQIMAFSRQQPIERKKVSVCSIVHEAGSLLKAALPPNVELHMECPPHQLQIEGDATQLGQVLLNLGTNAVHAIGGASGRISISLAGLPPGHELVPSEVRESEHAPRVVACIEVRDTGTGMSKSTMARIFEPFFTTKVVGKGTGLGLPVVLGIMQAHGGAITVDSELGKGAVFRLFLPAEAMDPAGANTGTMDDGMPTSSSVDDGRTVEEIKMSEGGTSSAGRVLYLDDDDTLVFLVKRLLQRRGYKVTAFCDQQEAIDAIRATPDGFDVLLTDYNMPGMSGIDVAKEALAINPSLTVAVASGYINEELEQKAQAVGVTEVVFKTDAIESFCDVVARLVKGSNAT
ncbi:ATP-binding protein [Hydrogenophaga sp. 5NK40-0174]|uniref:hybrid sensor histidine kinase/response regulator n=1 Tax=Hydrogenophaga sp. 5NK40-0174 TaxID=3127649 RepID=UPI00310AB76A